MDRRHAALLAVLIALAPAALVLGIWWGGHPEDLPGFVRDSLVGDGDAQTIHEAADSLRADYFRPLKDADLVNAALSGMVASLHDRFSNYLTPAQYRSYLNDSNAKFSGVGMTVRGTKRGLRVVTVFDHSPAKRANIRPGDLIVEAAGHRLAGKPASASAAVIRGRPGTDVRLVVDSGGHRRAVTLTRETVSEPVVASRLRTAPGGVKVGQVALATFSSGAHGELRQAIDKRLHEGAKGLILDLRHNGGGLVEEARLIGSIFLERGPIVSTRGRNQPSRTLTSSGGAIDARIPVVVLVDRETASASEIVTGALQDRHRATVVGSHTFGKGVFQEVKPLRNGGGLEMTVGEYFTPSGHNLGGGGVRRGAGITPDVRAADNPRTRADEALTVALRVLAKKLHR